MKTLSLSIVLAAFAATLLSPSPSHAADLKPQVDALAQPLVDDGVVVGMVVGVVRDGKEHVFAYGLAAQGSKQLPGRDTVYEIGSVSKVFTGVLLADMVERGILKLDDPLSRHVPDGVTAPVAEDQPITLLHLATHTSGLPRLPDNFAPADVENPYADYSVEQMYAFLSEHKLRRPPGKYEYSNYAMGLLGQVLANKAGKGYEELLVERICGPLEMNDSRVALTDSMRQRLAPGHNAGLEQVKCWDIVTLAGAGGIRSTCGDMLKFIAANLRDDDEPLTKALAAARVKHHAMDDGLAMGVSWHIARDKTTRWHTGMTGGYATWLAVVPGSNVGVVVLCNTATPRVFAVGEEITRVAFGETVEPPKRRKEVDVDAKTLEQYVGRYAVTPEFIFTVTLDDGRLMVQATGQPKLPVYAESPTEFFYKVIDAQISFDVEDGKATKLTLHQGGRDIEALKQ